MTRAPITPIKLFKVLMLVFCYLALTVVLMGFAVPELVSSQSTLAVVVGVVWVVLWLIGSVCGALQIINNRQLADTTEKHQ